LASKPTMCRPIVNQTTSLRVDTHPAMADVVATVDRGVRRQGEKVQVLFGLGEEFLIGTVEMRC